MTGDYPNFKEEEKIWKQGVKHIAGIDEVGRGPLAGPVVAAAVIIKSNHQFPSSSIPEKSKRLKIKDSKKLSPIQREKVFEYAIAAKDINFGIGIVSEKIIDKSNILKASLLAMKEAVEQLKIKPEFLLIDGQHTLEDVTLNQKAIVNGDTKVFSIAIASIIAKVTRDHIMSEYHKQYPNYGFNLHKGYGTKTHLDALDKYGACAIHRRSFRPVKKAMRNYDY